MKMNVLKAAALTLFLTAGAVIAQQAAAPDPATDPAPQPVAQAQAPPQPVCVIVQEKKPPAASADGAAPPSTPGDDDTTAMPSGAAAAPPSAAAPVATAAPPAATAPVATAPPPAAKVRGAAKPSPKGKAAAANGKGTAAAAPTAANAPVAAVPSAANAPDAAAPAVANAPAGAAAPAAPALQELPDDVTANCADGKVVIEIVSRTFGHKIGDVVPVEMQIKVDSTAQIDLDPLRQGKLVLDDKGSTQFELAGMPFIQEDSHEGTKLYDIVLPVRNFEPKPTVVFTMQLPYAVGTAPGAAPAWQTLTTPEFRLSQYIDDAKGFKREMIVGNTAAVAPRSPWSLPLLMIVFTLLFFTWPGILMVRYINRVRTHTSASRDAVAWLALNRVKRSGKEIGFGTTHYQRIAQILRKYLQNVYPGIEGMTLPEVESLPNEPRAAKVKSVFRKLDRVLVDVTPLSAAEQAQLLEELDELVVRPFTI